MTVIPARAMKPSGLGWAGEIPAHWDVAKICLVARLESAHTPSRQHPEYWIPNECTIPWFSLADVWQLREGTQEFLVETSEKISPLGMANSAARLLPTGTVVLSRTASVGFSGIMPQPMATTQDFANWVPGERVLSEFLLFALRAMREEFERATMGSTHQTIYMPDIRRLAIPIPPKDEQARVVAFLRERLPKLDELIAKKERLVEVFVEKRQALVTQAVTKGLDPDVPMKESGAPWLGAVPAHWEVMQVRRLFERSDYGISASLNPAGAIAVLRMSNIQDGRVVLDDLGYVDTLDDSRLLLEPGDLLFNRTNSLDLVGKVGMFCAGSEMPVSFASYLVRFRVKPKHSPKYVSILLNTAGILGRARALALPSISQSNLNPNRYGALVICVPPRDEQELILRALNATTGRLDEGINQTATSIEKLREYRQALITAAVTGKLDIAHEARAPAHSDREVAAP